MPVAFGSSRVVVILLTVTGCGPSAAHIGQMIEKRFKANAQSAVRASADGWKQSTAKTAFTKNMDAIAVAVGAEPVSAMMDPVVQASAAALKGANTNGQLDSIAQKVGLKTLSDTMTDVADDLDRDAKEDHSHDAAGWPVCPLSDEATSAMVSWFCAPDAISELSNTTTLCAKHESVGLKEKLVEEARLVSKADLIALLRSPLAAREKAAKQRLKMLLPAESEQRPLRAAEEVVAYMTYCDIDLSDVGPPHFVKIRHREWIREPPLPCRDPAAFNYYTELAAREDVWRQLRTHHGLVRGYAVSLEAFESWGTWKNDPRLMNEKALSKAATKPMGKLNREQVATKVNAVAEMTDLSTAEIRELGRQQTTDWQEAFRRGFDGVNPDHPIFQRVALSSDAAEQQFSKYSKLDSPDRGTTLPAPQLGEQADLLPTLQKQHQKEAANNQLGIDPETWKQISRFNITEAPETIRSQSLCIGVGASQLGTDHSLALEAGPHMS